MRHSNALIMGKCIDKIDFNKIKIGTLLVHSFDDKTPDLSNQAKIIAKKSCTNGENYIVLDWQKFHFVVLRHGHNNSSLYSLERK